MKNGDGVEWQMKWSENEEEGEKKK